MRADDVARQPTPGSSVPANAAFSPDGRHLAYLHSPERTLVRQLFLLDLDTGDTRAITTGGGATSEEELSPEERLRRERQRDLNLGVTSFAWATDGWRLLVPMPDGVHVLDEPDGELRLVVGAVSGEPILDPRLSPDGRRLAFVQDDELYVVDVDEPGLPKQLTSGARGIDGRTNGLAEYVAQEEMGRDEGFWWSPDGSHIAFAEVDESHVPTFRIVHVGNADPHAGEEHRYPFAGAENARVRIGIVDVSGTSPTTWGDLPDDTEYVARVAWADDGSLLVQTEDRRQQRLTLSRDGKVLVVDESDVWINLHDDLRTMSDGRFLWSSERSGHRHLEVRGSDGELERELTSGDWSVVKVEGLDEAKGLVWFTSTEEGVLERHLCEVPLRGGPVRRITTEPGTHAAVVDGKHGRFFDTYSSAGRPPVVTVRSLDDGEIECVVWREPDPRVEELGLRPPEFTTVVAADGSTPLHVAMLRPAGKPPFPTVVHVYGGPHAQLVADSWTATTRLLQAELLRQNGFLVAIVDNRGSANRGLAFEGAIKHRLGEVEVADQVAAVRALAERGLVDIERVGVTGWSYGGYMTLLCLATAGDVFRAGVAGAPVTFWEGYDTHYTERYLGLPAENAEGYEASSVLAHVGGISGRLLLVHGLIDENVHFRHTARLQTELIRRRVPTDMLLLPDERHSPRREEDRAWLAQRTLDFFCETLT